MAAIRVNTDNKRVDLTEDSASLEFSFSSSTTWIVVHNLNKYPSFTALDSSDQVISGKPSYTDKNTLQVVFGSAISGKLLLHA